MIKYKQLITILFILLIIISYFYFDKKVAEQMQNASKAFLDIGHLLSYTFSPTVVLTLTTLSLLTIKKRELLFFRIVSMLVAIASSLTIVSIIKFVGGRARPELFLTDGIYGFYFFSLNSLYTSFPSSHVAAAASLFASLSCLFPKNRFSFYLLTLIAAASRVVVNKHYISDCIASLVIGYFCANALVIKQESLWQVFKSSFLPEFMKRKLLK